MKFHNLLNHFRLNNQFSRIMPNLILNKAEKIKET